MHSTILSIILYLYHPTPTLTPSLNLTFLLLNVCTNPHVALCLADISNTLVRYSQN